ncbi:MAG: ATP-binding protein, partial [Vulcanimicrobiaceae bacterium]
YTELHERAGRAEDALERASTARAEADEAGRRFDDFAAALAGEGENRSARLLAARKRAADKRTYDGLGAQRAMLALRRHDLLGNDDEPELARELAELRAAGVEPAEPSAGAARALEAERGELARKLRVCELDEARFEAELATSEARIGDLAGPDERVAEIATQLERLEAFRDALELARETIERRTREAHERFARRLEEYASRDLAAISAERYRELLVDPATLAIRVRRDGGIAELDELSTGTREQAALAVRLSMARMFAEGLETAPILLDDPFAFWDDERVARAWPLLEEHARRAQLIVFTTSSALAQAARERGAALLSLVPEPALADRV